MPEQETAVSLLTSMRPRCLADLVGQARVIAHLRAYLREPCSSAFLFSGPTGIGKTLTAELLARELGVDVDRKQWGGFHGIASGGSTAEAVRGAMHALNGAAWFGSGWRVLRVDEADAMSSAAAVVWLSELENLPLRSVVVMTTNAPEKMPQRLRDRCEVLTFEAKASALMSHVGRLIRRVWEQEDCAGPPPEASALPGLVDADGNLSFRRVYRALEPMVRDRRRAEQ